MTKIKATGRVKQTKRENTGKPMSRGHVDLIGPFKIGYGKAKYAMLYICDDTHYGLIEATTDKEVIPNIIPPIEGLFTNRPS